MFGFVGPVQSPSVVLNWRTFKGLWETGVNELAAQLAKKVKCSMSYPPRERPTSIYPRSKSYAGVDEPRAGRRKQSILVVDDNAVNAALLKELLMSRGYPTVAVQSADAAEAEIRNRSPGPDLARCGHARQDRL